MRVKLQIATPDDAPDLVSLQSSVSQHLTARYGLGHWSSGRTEKGVLFMMRQSKIYIAKDGARIVASLTLSTRKPWAIDKSYFSPSTLPLYLTGMAVSPGEQNKGIGRQCLDEVRRIAREWPGDAIRLDAYDADAGAGEFYRKCGFREVGRVCFKSVPLIYFETLL